MSEDTRHLLKRFLAYYRPHCRLLTLDLSTAALRALFMIVIPFLVVRMLGREQLSEASLAGIWYTIAVLSVLILLMALAEFINVKWGHILGTRIETEMRGDLFRHLQKLSFRYFDNTKTGHIMSRISNDLFTISELAHHGPEDFLISLCLLGGSLIFMFIMNWQMAIIVMIPMPLILIWGNVYRLRLRRTFREVRRRVADINSNVENAIQGIREVQSYAKESYAIEQFDDVNSEFCMAKTNMYGQMAGFHSGMMFILESYSVIIIGGGMLLVHYGHLELVEMIGFLMYRRYMFQPIRRLTGFMEQYQQGVAAFERFVEIMDESPDIEDRPNAIALPKVKGDIEIENVSFKYYSDDPDWVLQNVNIHVRPGRAVALVGESGAGKSTIASLIPRFYEPQEGVIRVDGLDIMDLRKYDLRRQIGIVQQSVFLFDSSIRENIMFGRPEATEEELIEAAKNAHIYDVIQALPNGFDTLVGERGVKLSGGQQQRVSIARLFLKNPSVLIFDEATSSLDTESEELIQKSMDALCEGRSTLIIAHRLSTVRRADYTYVLREGGVVEEGSHEELIARRGYYFDLYNRHVL
ncbi:MAG: ABC transporter ATP-binding protein [Kiritimatiellae bacterium]|nr:ABC transporter ATP-binding protein [Kiritimatiellia bacterium]